MPDLSPDATRMRPPAEGGGDDGDAGERDADDHFLTQLRDARRAYPLPPQLRALSEQFAEGALALLFPHFTRDVTQTSLCEMPALRAECEALRALLREALAPLAALAPSTGSAAAVLADHVFARLPAVRAALLEDARAIADGDPAAESVDAVIVAYPGFYAIAVHRIAHLFYEAGVPLFPRLLSEFAHRETGIDIHPGARIGAAFSIDHGTGVVVGETAVIGDRVKLFQGVTLGALMVKKGLASTKRHPTIGNDVVVYSNATILGGDTVVGDGSVVGGNVWLTRSVPPNSVVTYGRRAEAQHAEFPLEYNI
jgi:serine O-acetyltransferase